MTAALELGLAWSLFCEESSMPKKKSSRSSDYVASAAAAAADPAEGSVPLSRKRPCSDNTELEVVPYNDPPPTATPLQISTRSKISFLNRSINLATTFWSIPVLPYHLPAVGVIKKQMKFKCDSQEELDALNLKCDAHENVELYLISQHVTPSAKVPFKDIRKVSIGLCCKDITSYRRKKRKAFYNCFVMLLRIMYKGAYKEMHVKVFNTGRLEITGIQTDELLDIVHKLLLDILQPIVTDGEVLQLQDKESDTVLINSHFKCGYFINRERFHQILKYDYNINSNYDPCSYPGIQCEFYYDTRLKVQHGMQPATFSEDRKDLEIEKEAARAFVQKVSFMIFRTGSVLIVGKCSDAILNEIYQFLCALFIKEYKEIRGTTPAATKEVVKKARKIRKKTIYI